MNMVGNLGAFAFINTVPLITKYTTRWDLVLVLFGVLYVCAGLFWVLLDPRQTVFSETHEGADSDASR